MNNPAKKYLVVGAGNIGLATAAFLADQGADIYLYTRRKTTIAKTKTLYSTGLISSGTQTIAECSTNLATLVKKSGRLIRRVIIGCWGNDVENLAVRFAPYVSQDLSILLICSGRFAGLLFLKTLSRLGVPPDQLPAVADVHVSPFVSRSNADDQVNIIALKNDVSVAA